MVIENELDKIIRILHTVNAMCYGEEKCNLIVAEIIGHSEEIKYWLNLIKNEEKVG